MSCKSCNSFGSNCPYNKTKFGGLFSRRPDQIENKPLTWKLLYSDRRYIISIYLNNRLAYDNKESISKLVNRLMGLYPSLTIADIKMNLNNPSMRLSDIINTRIRKNQFGKNCKVNFGSSCHPHQSTSADIILNKFGVKASSIKGYSSLTKQHLTSFYAINGIDIPMSATKDQLYNNIKGIYSGLTPADIKNSVAKSDTIANIRAAKQSQKEAEQIAKRAALEEKERLKGVEIKKITYSPRAVQKEFEFVSRRLPAGSKVKRLSRPGVTQTDIDDLSDMLSAARASPDQMSDLLTGLSVKFGKNKFGA